MKCISQHCCDKTLDDKIALVLRMLFSELYTIMVNKVNLQVLGGRAIVPLDSPCLDTPANANGFDAPRVQNCLLEFSVKHTHNCHAFRICLALTQQQIRRPSNPQKFLAIA